MSLRRKQIRNLVNKILLDNNISDAPIPVEKVAENLGATVVYEPAEDSLSGFILKKENEIIIGINKIHGENRKRFTLAHEIGHLLLHVEETFHIDKKNDGFSITLQSKKFARNEDSAKGTDKIEKEANLFAAELLMPADFIERDMSMLGNIDLLHGDELIELAEKYQVSNRAMTYRLANLKYIQI